jgi:hypothetical protein
MAFNLLPSKFEIDEFSAKDLMYANYTDENVLFKTHPRHKMWQDVTDSVLEYVATASPNIYGKETSLLKSFSKNDAIRMVDSEWIRWSLKGGGGKVKCVSMENMQPGNQTPGIGWSEVYLKYSHEFFVSGDTIYPQTAPSVEFTVQGEGVSDGTGFVYTLILKTTDEFEYVEPELLEESLIWCKRGATHSEASAEYGSSYFPGGPSLLTFQTTLGSYSKMHEVTDKGLHQILRLRAQDSAGNYMPNIKDQVVHYSEAEFMAQCRYEREQDLFWGRDAGRNILDPTTGYHRRTGPGMLEFYEDGNMLEYNEANFTVDFLREQFRDYWYGKVTPAKANIVVKCGIELLTLVDKAITAEYAKAPVQKNFGDYVKDGASFPGSKQVGRTMSRPQFLAFEMFPYGEIRFEHMPILDDVEMNGGLVHPDTNRPLTSYWGFVDDIGIGSTNNVELMVLRGSEYMNYVCGAYSPAGAIDGTNNRGFVATHGRRSYQILYNIVSGVRMKDTKRTMFLHPGVEW